MYVCVYVCFAIVLAYLDFMSNLCNETLLLLRSY